MFFSVFEPIGYCNLTNNQSKMNLKTIHSKNPPSFILFERYFLGNIKVPLRKNIPMTGCINKELKR
jgi:hypothetical protein